MQRQILYFIFLFFLGSYFYLPIGFGQDGGGGDARESDPRVSDSNDIEELRRQIRQVQQDLNELREGLPDEIRTEVEEVNSMEKQLEEEQEKRWRAQSRQSRWTLEGGPRRFDLNGRMLVGSGPDYEGAYGVLFDVDTGSNIHSRDGADRVNFYRAKITPFIQFDTWGAQMALNVRKFLENEVIKGEIRDQISDEDFESAYVYFRPINREQVEVIAYLGRVDEPFVREVVDSSIFTNRSILDKYRLNTSMALRVDLGLGRMEGSNLRGPERPIWVQAASFNLDKDNRSFNDFALRVILSLAILNRFSEFNLDFVQMWGGYAQIKSGGSTAGETDAVTDPSQAQRMMVFGLQFDLNKLTGEDLGIIYGEFVRRKKSGDITDQSWVIGYEVKIPKQRLETFFGFDLLPHIGEEGRSVEIGVRYQNQQDDPDALVSDGSVIQTSLFYPLTDQNIGVRVNAGYIIKSTDPDRDGLFIFSAEIEVLW